MIERFEIDIKIFVKNENVKLFEEHGRVLP